MKRGDMVITTNSSWIRGDPVAGGEVGKYPAGIVLIILEDDDPRLYHIRVLAPDGKSGWIFKDVTKSPHETR